MILLISGVLISIISGHFSFSEKSKDNLLEGKSNNYNKGIFITLIIGSLMTLVSGVQSNISAKENEDSLKIKDLRNLSLLKDNLRLSNELNHKSDSLRDKIEFAKDRIIALQDIGQKGNSRIRDSLDRVRSQIIDLQSKNFLEIFNQTTGGLSPPKIVCKYSSNSISFSVQNNSNYVIPDIFIQYTDHYAFHKEFGFTVNEDVWDQGPQRNIHVTSVYPKTISKNFCSEDIPDTWPELKYDMMIYYKTGSYRYLVKFERDNKGEFHKISESFTNSATGKPVVFN